VAIKAVVSARARERIRELLREVSQEKGSLRLAMLAQSSPELPNRWNFIVSAPWIDAAGVRPTISYLSSCLKQYLDRHALSTIDRISTIPSNDPLVDRILHYAKGIFGSDAFLREGELFLQNWVIGDLIIPEGYIFVADPDSNAQVKFLRSAREAQKSAR
jgi:hypothetical protein